jgi:hypothetical protein
VLSRFSVFLLNQEMDGWKLESSGAQVFFFSLAYFTYYSNHTLRWVVVASSTFLVCTYVDFVLIGHICNLVIIHVTQNWLPTCGAARIPVLLGCFWVYIQLDFFSLLPWYCLNKSLFSNCIIFAQIKLICLYECFVCCLTGCSTINLNLC